MEQARSGSCDEYDTFDANSDELKNIIMHKYYEYINKIINKLVPHNITCMYPEQQI